MIGIIGRNGAGKSTLLKILSRITQPTTGRVRLRGRVASLLEVGTGFHPELTGRENIYLNGAILGMTRAEIRRKFDEIVAFAEVAKFLDTPVKRYSSGMYVRLAFAVAAHLEPEVLIVDEVLAVGDTEFQKKCLGKMRDVSSGGRTVLFVSHNMAAVQSLCSTGILLDGGQLLHLGSIASAVARYAGISPTCTTSGSLGPHLIVRGLELSPPAISTGGPMRMLFQLVPKERTTIRELAILIYSEFGARVAVLDLRRGAAFPFLLSEAPLDFEIRLDRLALVEGDYRLGFYVVTNDYNGNYFDVASFTVIASPSKLGTAPYPPQYGDFWNSTSPFISERSKGSRLDVPSIPWWARQPASVGQVPRLRFWRKVSVLRLPGLFPQSVQRLRMGMCPGNLRGGERAAAAAAVPAGNPHV